MRFFTDRSEYTHDARFYGIPMYARFEGQELVLTGTNIVFEWLIVLMSWVHNTFIESGAQMLAAFSGADYVPHFPIRIREKGFDGEEIPASVRE